MSLAIGKRDVTRMADLLNRDWGGVEEVAKPALELAFDMYEAKARYIVVGQVKGTAAATGPRDEPDPTKVALGPYGTWKQALDAALAMTVSRPTGELFQTWAVAYHHGTPHAYFMDRKAELDHATPAPLNQSQRLAVLEGWLSTSEALKSATDPSEGVPCPFCGCDLPDPAVYALPAS